MSRFKLDSTLPWLIAFVLIGVGVTSRWLLIEIPNFKPVAAIALFAGFYFANWRMALLIPLLVLAFTDLRLGSYQPSLLAVVYLCLMLPAVAGRAIRGNSLLRPRTWGALVLLSVGMSCLFFLATNIACWLVTPWYPRDIAGLGHCMTAAIPFFRFTLLGDLAFTTCLFGGYAMLVNAWSKSRVPAGKERGRFHSASDAGQQLVPAIERREP